MSRRPPRGTHARMTPADLLVWAAVLAVPALIALVVAVLRERRRSRGGG